MALASHQCPGMHLLIRLRGHVPLRLPLHWATGSSRAFEPACLLGVVLTMKPQVMWHCGCGLQVVCKGTEERLRDCSFPENFTSRSGRRGLSETCAADQNQRLGIVCRRFTIPGVDPSSQSQISACWPQAHTARRPPAFTAWLCALLWQIGLAIVLSSSAVGHHACPWRRRHRLAVCLWVLSVHGGLAQLSHRGPDDPRSLLDAAIMLRASSFPSCAPGQVGELAHARLCPPPS